MNVENIYISSTFLRLCPLNLNFKLNFNIPKNAYFFGTLDLSSKFKMVIERSATDELERLKQMNARKNQEGASMSPLHDLK